jgi:hypothetical protein
MKNESLRRRQGVEKWLSHSIDSGFHFRENKI